VAWRILGEDVSQIDYYTERVKRIVCKVRTFNGITRYERGTYDLVGGEELSDAEREELRWLRNRTIKQRTADVFVQNTTDQRLIRNAFLQGFDT
jgi:hypothetical protein